MDIAVGGVSSHVVLAHRGKEFKAMCIALCAVGPTPNFVREAGDSLAGQAVSDEAIAAAAQSAARPSSAIALAAQLEMCHLHCRLIGCFVFERRNAINYSHFTTCSLADILDHARASRLHDILIALTDYKLRRATIGINRFYICLAEAFAQALFHFHSI